MTFENHLSSASASRLALVSNLLHDGVSRGAANALRHYKAALELLSAHRLAGRAVAASGMRILGIARTPFSVVYQVREDHLRVARIFDNRSQPVSNWDEL